MGELVSKYSSTLSWEEFEMPPTSLLVGTSDKFTRLCNLCYEERKNLHTQCWLPHECRLPVSVDFSPVRYWLQVSYIPVHIFWPINIRGSNLSISWSMVTLRSLVWSHNLETIDFSLGCARNGNNLQIVMWTGCLTGIRGCAVTPAKRSSW